MALQSLKNAPCSINIDYGTPDHSISEASHIFPAPCSINNDYSTPDHSISKASHIFPAPCSINNDYSTPGYIAKPLFKYDMTSYSGSGGINFDYFNAQSHPC